MFNRWLFFFVFTFHEIVYVCRGQRFYYQYVKFGVKLKILCRAQDFVIVVHFPVLCHIHCWKSILLIVTYSIHLIRHGSIFMMWKLLWQDLSFDNLRIIIDYVSLALSTPPFNFIRLFNSGCLRQRCIQCKGNELQSLNVGMWEKEKSKHTFNQNTMIYWHYKHFLVTAYSKAAEEHQVFVFLIALFCFASTLIRFVLIRHCEWKQTRLVDVEVHRQLYPTATAALMINSLFSQNKHSELFNGNNGQEFDTI